MGLLNRVKKMKEKKIIDQQGGEKTSVYLRKITAERNKVEVGMHSYGSCFHNGFNVGGNVVVGRYTSFGPDIHFFGANHPMNYASMSPYFYQKSWSGKKEIKDIERYTLSVGNDVWIGYGTIITCNCHSIGNGAVIGAGSVVTKNVEPYSIVVGNPAKKLRYRFDDEVRELLEESKWYELEPEELLNFYEYIDQPTEFARAVIQYRKQ